MKVYGIEWPERKSIPENILLGWYRDCVANGEIERDETAMNDPEIAARLLDQEGIITLNGRDSVRP